MQDEGQTALHIATWEGDENMVKHLVTMKANPTVKDKVGGRH